MTKSFHNPKNSTCVHIYVYIYIYIYKYIYIYTYNYTKGRKFFHDAIISILLMYNTIVFMTVSFILRKDFTRTVVFPFHGNQKQGLLTNNKNTQVHTYLQSWGRGAL